MVIVFTVLSAALALLVISINIQSWLWRMVWVLVAGASLFLLGTHTRMFGPFGVVVLLSMYQSYKNRGLESDD